MTKKKAQQETSPKPASGDYRRFISGLQLVSIRLASASIRFSPDIYVAKRLPPFSFSLAAELGEVSPKDFEASQEAVVRARETTRSPILMSIKCKFTARYETETQVNPEFFTVFKDTTLVINVWPYIREFVQNCVVRAGLPPLTLPSQIYLPKQPNQDD